MKLPYRVDKVIVPPIKIQGIKTKLVNFILGNIRWEGKGYWIEPFLGSGVVVFNLNPEKAILNDNNPYIIEFYKSIYEDKLSVKEIENYLYKEGEKLSLLGASYYYEVRDRFNKNKNILDFLFLNRTCYNGLIRFNKNGEFNAPFCKKPEIFKKSYISKLVNKIRKIKEIMQNRKWIFYNKDWKDVIVLARAEDFVYLDPPYIGRHTNYYDGWTKEDAFELADFMFKLPCGFAISMWKMYESKVNPYIEYYKTGTVEKTFSYTYRIGPQEKFRNKVLESLLIKTGWHIPEQNFLV